jgi:ubiquitin thioesterase protein OTUB1
MRAMPGVGYQAYGHAPRHYHESAVAFGALPFRPPELASTRYQQHPHADPFNYTSQARMSDPAFLTPEEEFAQLQKLSNEYEPEATVSCAAKPPARGVR